MSTNAMARKPLPAILLALTVWLAACDAGDPRQPMIVGTDWVAERLDDPSLVLLHIGDRDGYDAAHLPGARYVERAGLSTPHGEGLMLELPPVAQLQEVFEELGVSDDSKIVLYWGEEWVTATTRAYLTLDYLGLADRTSIMDGGMRTWVEEEREVTAESPAIERGSFTPRLHAEVIADIDWIVTHADDPNVALLDARNKEFYTGERSGRNMRTGHIPGSRSLPFTSVVDESTLKFLDRESLEQMYRAAGADPGDTVVTYCHIGQQATVTYFVAKYLGYDARLYDGSFEEWSSREEMPVEVSTGI